MAKGIVYILTNPCLDGWVKIGMSEKSDISRRLKELNTPTNLPLSYRCYATYSVEQPAVVEKSIHRIIDKIDNSLHARELLSNGKIREREFFKITLETAFSVFHEIAKLRGDDECLKLYTPTVEESKEEEIAEIRTKKSNNSFKLLGIQVGDELNFLLNESIVVKVANDKTLLNIMEKNMQFLHFQINCSLMFKDGLKILIPMVLDILLKTVRTLVI